jgi:ADP-ribose pyrophosphatase YjhB (NUDIX family)
LGTDSVNAAVTRLVCSSCGFPFWQNSKPAVAALITKVMQGRHEILLTRRGVPPFQGMWDLPGGFLENGELPEIGLAREMIEELGVRIVQPRLVSMGIDEYPGDDIALEARFVLSLYYRCGIPPGARIAAADDVVEAAWFPLDQPPEEIAFASNRGALEVLRASVKSESARTSASG